MGGERNMNIYKGAALFAGGVLFGSAGLKLLSSKDAKKSLYTRHRCGAADEGLRHGDGHLRPGERC